jgi:lysophospholipase L1-like esterase
MRINGVTHIILLEGINDIGASGQSPIFGDNPSLQAEELIAAYGQAIARAHARGIKLIIGTLLPFAGAFYASPEREQIRLAVNQWIRTSKEPDAVIDFEDITRDSANSGRLSAAYNSGDHLHPSEAGYKAIGDAIDLALFR